MKVDYIATSPMEPAFIPIGGGKWKLSEDTVIRIHTNEGVLCFYAQEGFITDFRSGGRLVDYIAPRVGNLKIALSWFTHDLMYRLKCVSKGLSDEILRQSLIIGGLSPWRAKLVKSGLWFGGRGAYDDIGDESKVKFQWLDK